MDATKKEAWHDAWSQIDQTSDPHFFVRFLDNARRPVIRSAHANPAKFFEHLHIRSEDHVLEIGCGTGDLLAALAELVGVNGRVVGTDSSRAMIAEAVKRNARAGAKVEFVQADAHCLDMAGDQFDLCLATSVFQHLADPMQALGELVRVARPGGRIVLNETDWDTQVVDADNIEVTRKVVSFMSDSIKNGTVARRLPGMMKEHGLIDIRVSASSLISTKLSDPIGAWLSESAQRAARAGVIPAVDADQWLADISERGRQDRFFAAFTTFHISGTKPA